MLRAAAGSDEQPAETPSKRQRVDRREVELAGVDKGRVLWLPSAHSWQVVYVDAGGVTRRTKKHLQVPKVDTLGRELRPGRLKEERRNFLLAARRRWNELDQSKNPRYPEVMMELAEIS